MTSKKIKIIIIEDEELLVDVLTKKLEQAGYEVFSAGDGQEGLEKIEKLSPDLILLDIVMPKMDGYEVLSALKEKYGVEKMIPVIIISNSGQPVELDKVKSLGAKDYLIKAQFTPEEVLSKVKKVLGQSASVPTDEDGDSSNSISILIIEDDQFLRDLLSTKLRKENFEVQSAIDGPGGIEKIIKEKPDVVLLDIILPGIDGFEILTRVRSNSDKAISDIPIILLSNLGQEADVEKGKKLGANDYLIKSNFTIDEIIDKIRSTLSEAA